MSDALRRRRIGTTAGLAAAAAVAAAVALGIGRADASLAPAAVARWPWAPPVTIKTIPPHEAVVLPVPGSYAQHGAALARLAEYLRSAGIVPAGDAYGRYLGDPGRLAEGDRLAEVGFPVPPGAAAAAPFEIKRFPAQLSACADVGGPRNEDGLGWLALYGQLATTEYAVDGAALVIWRSATEQTKGSITELCVPVRRLVVPLLLFRQFVAVLGASLFALVSLLYLRQWQRRVTLWGGSLWAGVGACFFLLYAELLLDELGFLYGGGWLRPASKWSDALSLAAAPLLMHLFYNNERCHLPGRRWLGATVAVTYALAVGFTAAGLFAPDLGIAASWRPWQPGRIGASFAALAASFNFVILQLSRRPHAAFERRARRAYRTVVGSAAILALLVLLWPRASVGTVARTVLFAVPIPLLFVTAYYNERALFFDVLVKRGVFLLLALALLSAYFVLAPRLLFSIRMGAVGGWVYPVSALPLLLAAPWGYARLASLLDRHWLGRRLTAAQAGKHFVAGLGGALSEDELVRAAEARLSTILQAEVHVRIGPGSEAPDGSSSNRLVVAIQSPQAERIGALEVDTRASRRHLLSEDRTLVESLADAFALTLDNVRLRGRRLEQEKREQQLLQEAGRAQLRALRAQVNPHFLFNALNTIAALIPRDPARAEETVEQLAEVFRYALRDAEKEWVPLAEEMLFVRSYLEVERTRFAGRLSVRTELDDGARRAFIPAMFVQTLVENAIKHGVADRRSAAVVEVDARTLGERLWVVVCDNGPGFPLAAIAETAPAAEGHGLRNLRARLQGYFGDNACLRIGRDPVSAATCVTLELPWVTALPWDGAGAA